MFYEAVKKLSKNYWKTRQKNNLNLYWADGCVNLLNFGKYYFLDLEESLIFLYLDKFAHCIVSNTSHSRLINHIRIIAQCSVFFLWSRDPFVYLFNDNYHCCLVTDRRNFPNQSGGTRTELELPGQKSGRSCPFAATTWRAFGQATGNNQQQPYHNTSLHD